jgi:hypothetical protein
MQYKFVHSLCPKHNTHYFKGIKMKKIFAIFAILAMAVSTTAMADSITFRTQLIDGVDTTNSTAYQMVYAHDVNKQVSADVSFSQTQSDTAAKTITTRMETGLRYTTTPIFGNVKGTVRTALGERFSTKGNTTYWSVEPGITMPIGPFNTRFAYRYRSSVDTAQGDQTNTARVNVSYPFTKQDSVAVGYDRMRGDSNQNVVRLSYTRSF